MITNKKIEEAVKKFYNKNGYVSSRHLLAHLEVSGENIGSTLDTLELGIRKWKKGKIIHSEYRNVNGDFCLVYYNPNKDS